MMSINMGLFREKRGARRHPNNYDLPAIQGEAKGIWVPGAFSESAGVLGQLLGQNNCCTKKAYFGVAHSGNAQLECPFPGAGHCAEMLVRWKALSEVR